MVHFKLKLLQLHLLTTEKTAQSFKVCIQSDLILSSKVIKALPLPLMLSSPLLTSHLLTYSHPTTAPSESRMQMELEPHKAWGDLYYS